MLDTASYADRLQREGNFTASQARLLAQQRYEIEEHMMTKSDLAHLATKQDLSEVRLEISDLRSDIKVLKWGIGVVIVGVLMPLLKSLLPYMAS